MARVGNPAAGNAANVGSSPPSGSDHTHYNTPSTNITVVSPAQDHGNTPAPKLNLGNIQLAVPRATDDPVPSQHLGPPTASDTVSLSPTAEEFTPSVRTVVHAPIDAVAQASNGRSQSLTLGSTFGAIGQAIPARQTATGTRKEQMMPLNGNVRVAIGKFSNEDQISRVFEISGIARPDPVSVAASFPTNDFKSLAEIDSSEMHRGVIRLVFSSIRDARQAFIRAAYTTHTGCTLTFVSPKTLAAARGENHTAVTDHAAQLLVTVAPHQQGGQMISLTDLYCMLSQAGEIYALHSVDATSNGGLTFRVEYCDVHAAASAVDLLNFGDFANVQIRAASFKPDVKQPAATVYHSAHERLSLTGRSTLPSDDVVESENLMARLMVDTSPGRGLGRTGHNQVEIIRIEEGADVRTTIMLRNIPNKVTQNELKKFLDETSLGAYDFMYLRIDFANNCNVGYAFINFVDPLAIIPFAQARSGVKWNIHDSNKVAEISYATIQGRDCLIQKFRNSSVMLEHPTFRPKLYYTVPHPLAGQEERFPDPDNFSKMRRSIENAEHIGLFRPVLGGHKVALAPAKVDQGPQSPARVTSLTSARSMASPVVDVHHPGDPFAGASGRQATTPTSFAPRTSPNTSGLFAPREGQQHRDEQRRRRSQFDRGTPGAEFEASAHRLADPALEYSRRAVVHHPRFAHTQRDRF